MTRVDPQRRRMREAFKRMQLLGAKPGVAARPFSRFIKTLQIVYPAPGHAPESSARSQSVSWVFRANICAISTPPKNGNALAE